MGKECRTTPRLDFGLRVILLKTGAAYFTKDISMKGCFIAAPQSLQIGDHVDLAIDVPGFGHLAINGDVRHVSEAGTGILFLKIENTRGKKVLEEFLEVISLCDESVESSGLGWLK